MLFVNVAIFLVNFMRIVWTRISFALVANFAAMILHVVATQDIV